MLSALKFKVTPCRLVSLTLKRPAIKRALITQKPHCAFNFCTKAIMDKSLHTLGAVAAPGTAFKENGDIDTDGIKSYVDFLANNNIDGVFVLGTLGEGMSLTVDERKKVAEAWVKHGAEKMKAVIVHVGTTNLRDSAELAAHAQEIKATAVACMAPFYFKPEDEEAMVQYMQVVASAASSLPFYYYCINFMTGVHLKTSKLLEMASERIPNLQGVKMSSRELPEMLDCTHACGGKFHIMIGTDEQFLTAFSLNVHTVVMNGYLGTIYNRLRTAFDKGDMETARKEQFLARHLVHVRSKYGGGPAAVKAFMSCLGVELGPVRLPLVDISASRLPELKQDLKAAGLPVV